MLTDASVYKTQLDAAISREKVKIFSEQWREDRLARKSGESDVRRPIGW